MAHLFNSFHSLAVRYDIAFFIQLTFIQLENEDLLEIVKAMKAIRKIQQSLHSNTFRCRNIYLNLKHSLNLYNDYLLVIMEKNVPHTVCAYCPAIIYSCSTFTLLSIMQRWCMVHCKVAKLSNSFKLYILYSRLSKPRFNLLTQNIQEEQPRINLG